MRFRLAYARVTSDVKTATSEAGRASTQTEIGFIGGRRDPDRFPTPLLDPATPA